MVCTKSLVTAANGKCPPSSEFTKGLRVSAAATLDLLHCVSYTIPTDLTFASTVDSHVWTD
jgi:hypothetical protein